MSDTYANVDASADPHGALVAQERIDQWPQIRAYKDRIRELLGDADSVVDVGCGSGLDVLAVGRSRCIGLDRSMVMCGSAHRRGAAVGQADVHHLPLADGTWAASVADRVIQHVDNPRRAVAEMLRVLRPGGRIVVADPDQGTLSIALPGVRQELVDRIRDLRRDIGYRNGTFVSSLPDMLAEFGCSGLSVDPFPLELTDPDDAFGLPGWPHYWQSECAFTADDQAEWDRGIARGREHGISYTLTYYVVSGERRTNPG